MTSLVTTVVLLAGCTGKYDGRYQYTPQPVDLQLVLSDQPEGSPATILTSVIGVRHDDKQAGIPTSVEVRMRIENNSFVPVGLDPNSLSLVAGNLVPFPQPLLLPPTRQVIPPTGTADFIAYFPFPDGKYPGEFDLNGLNLHWIVSLDGQATSQSATFERRPYVYSYPYPYGWWGYGYGYGYSPYGYGYPYGPGYYRGGNWRSRHPLPRPATAPSLAPAPSSK